MSDTIEQQVPVVASEVDTVWIAINTFLIVFMQLGFIFIEAGIIRKKNIHTIFVKNLLTISTTTIAWWLLGYAFAFGKSRGGFIGSNKDIYVANQVQAADGGYLVWFNQWALSILVVTIISGAVAERALISGFQVVSLFLIGFIYPVAVHWQWGDGWLQDEDFHDFAGAHAVLMAAGAAGLVYTIILKPRIGRFDPLRAKEFYPHNIKNIVIGTIILWFSWYGFNSGSYIGFGSGAAGTNFNGEFNRVGLVGINTTLSAIAGALTSFFLGTIIDKRVDYNDGAINLCKGIIAGLVSISGSVGIVEPWAAFVTGIIGALFYIGHSKLLIKLKIDDPLDVSSLFFAPGVWAGIATGFFQFKYGVIYGEGKIGIQLLGILCITAWVAGLTAVLCFIIKGLKLLRCSAQVEEIGFDNLYKQVGNADATGIDEENRQHKYSIQHQVPAQTEQNFIKETVQH